MKQVFLNSRQVAEVAEVDVPGLGAREVLVRVRSSLISTGTETAGYDVGSLVARGLRDPSRLKAVWESVRRDGLRETLERVRVKAHELTPRGYSGAGVVVGVGPEVRLVAVGDRVAYAGAPHAEYVAVSENLVAQMPAEVSFEEAAFGAVASIALHGVRLAEPTLGERVLVVGLGLIGLLAAQFARASGATVIAVEPLESRRALGRSVGVEVVLDPHEVEDLAGAVAFVTDGHGADAALLCAGGRDSTVTNLALAACRDRARVVMVGDMGLDLQRGPLFRKELAFRVSRSYGPGRYEPNYEVRGLDYPIGYVRWTEGRNLACFLDLIARGTLRVRAMISRRFPLVEAGVAYRVLIDDPVSSIAVLLEPEEHDAMPAPAPLRRRARAARPELVRVGVIGCGSFVTQQLLPHFESLGAALHGVANKSSVGFAALEARYRPSLLTTSVDCLLEEPAIDAFIVGTRHNLHAPLAERILRIGKPVHVEKPMAMSAAEAGVLSRVVREVDGMLTVGYNRRFAPTVDALREALATCVPPRQFLYRVNALPVPMGHWILDPIEGGGRMVGEGCHFIDLICYLAGADLSDVSGSLVGGANPAVSPRDNFAVTLRFANGDVGTVVYTAQGSPGPSKERLEVFSGGRVFDLEDFLRLHVYGARKPALVLRRADKGFRGHLENFFESVRGRGALRTTAQDGVRVAQIIERVSGAGSLAGG